MELSLKLQSGNTSPALWGPSPQHNPVNHAHNSSFQSLPSGVGLNGGPRKIRPHPNPRTCHSELISEQMGFACRCNSGLEFILI